MVEGGVRGPGRTAALDGVVERLVAQPRGLQESHQVLEQRSRRLQHIQPDITTEESEGR